MELFNIFNNKYYKACHNRKLSKHIMLIRNYAKDYIEKNEDLKEIINYAQTKSQSSAGGIKAHTYTFLHLMIRKRKPKYILECGTGKTTMIMAQAMLENMAETGVTGKIVSMEDQKKWYDHQVSLFPEKFKDIVDLCYSPSEIYNYAFVRGTVYKEIPDYPYEFMFVDGPSQSVIENGERKQLCNMDFIRLVEKSSTPITAILDGRKSTMLAYSMIFGPDKIRWYPAYVKAIIEHTTKDDLILNDTLLMKKRIFPQVFKADPIDPIDLKMVVK